MKKSSRYTIAALAVVLCVTVAAVVFLVIRVQPVCAACGYVYVTDGNCDQICSPNTCPPQGCSIATWRCTRNHWHRYAGPYSHGRISSWFEGTVIILFGGCPGYCN